MRFKSWNHVGWLGRQVENRSLSCTRKAVDTTKTCLLEDLCGVDIRSVGGHAHVRVYHPLSRDGLQVEAHAQYRLYRSDAWAAFGQRDQVASSAKMLNATTSAISTLKIILYWSRHYPRGSVDAKAFSSRSMRSGS